MTFFIGFNRRRKVVLLLEFLGKEENKRKDCKTKWVDGNCEWEEENKS